MRSAILAMGIVLVASCAGPLRASSPAHDWRLDLLDGATACDRDTHQCQAKLFFVRPGSVAAEEQVLLAMFFAFEIGSRVAIGPVEVRYLGQSSRTRICDALGTMSSEVVAAGVRVTQFLLVLEQLKLRLELERPIDLVRAAPDPHPVFDRLDTLPCAGGT